MDLCPMNNIRLEESMYSLDAADVLIHSTSAICQSREKIQSENIESALSYQRNIHIYVRRLSYSVHTSCSGESGSLEEMVPPVFPVNTHSTPPTAPEDRHHTASVQDFGVTKSRDVRQQLKLPRGGRDALKTSVTQTRDNKREGEDVLISRYSAHGRGAVVAALKHRSHSAPVRREVKVQLLETGRPQGSEPNLSEVPPNAALSSQNAGASTVAAITAAAIAATAPLIKAQSDMEARVAQVASELRRLQESEGKENDASETRPGTGADRMVQLQEQQNVLIQQRIQHLEMIQGQQFELQNRLLGSALDAVTARTIPPSEATLQTGSGVTLPECVHRPGLSRLHVVENPAAEISGSTVAQEQSTETERRVKSPLQVPAPRNIIPKPTRWNPAAYGKQNRTHKPAQTNCGNGRMQKQISNNQKSTRCTAQPDGVRQVAIETVNDGQPERSRENPGEKSLFPSGTVEPERPTGALSKLLSNNKSQESLKGVPTLIHAAPRSTDSAAQQANETLQDLSRLKVEMRNLFQTADAFPVKPAEPSQPPPPTLPSPPPQPPPPVTMPEHDDVVPPKAIPLSRSNQLQNSHPPTSMFEDAECVLRQVRQSRKVLEENLQAILRAKDGEVLHKQLEALSFNRDASEELRIKKTVDAWINTLSKEIQDELTQHGSVVQLKALERDRVAAGGSAQREQSSRSRSTAGKEPGRPGRERKGATAAARRKASHRDSNRPQTVSTQASSQVLASSFRNSTGRHTQASVVMKSAGDEAYLTKVYGKALYEGHRRTLKKGPYLRFSSPTPKAKGQHPKVVESVKGVKMKSCKTQTSVSDATPLQPVTSEPQYMFSPCLVQEQQPGSLLKGYLMPMAIPLGKPRVDGQTSRIIISDKPATVITSIPPAPRVAPLIRKPNTLLLEVHSEPKKHTPHLQIQVQPSVNIESLSALSRTPSPSPSPSHPPLLPEPSCQTGAGAQALEDEAEENDGFPMTNFLEVADNSQESEMEAVFPDTPIELHGLPSPPVALYHGPTFPAQPSQRSPLTQPILTAIQHRQTLENRLVDWVEQQLMARMISGMFPQPSHTDPATQSEPEASVTSDAAEETAGGLQLFVDAGVPVDSELIRQYVNEVLADIIALTLGQREGPREPRAPASTQSAHILQQETSVPTPVPTPEPSVKENPPALRDAPSPISTPDLSEHPSPDQSLRDSQHAQPQQQLSPEPEKDLVETPLCTPVPSPRRTETPESENLHNHPWGNTELPLTEEKPHSEGDETQPLPIVLSVAHEEEEEVLIHPFSPVPPKPQNPPTAAVEHTEPATPESLSVKENSSHSSTSITETEMETETAARHISEGELILSCGQMAAVRALTEEGFTLQNLMSSFNSSLHGVQDMDYDPPSEGEVIRRPLLSAHHDPVLSLLARMEQGPVNQSQQPERWWDEESTGEVSEGQRPVLTDAQERVVTGHSLIPQHQPIQPAAKPSSPGQSQAWHTGEKGEAAKNGGLSVNISLSAEHTESPHVLHSFTESSLQPADYTRQQASETTPHTVHKPTPILVKQYKSTEEPGDEGAQLAGRSLELMSDQLPSSQRDSQSPTISTVEGDSDSFSDMFSHP